MANMLGNDPSLFGQQPDMMGNRPKPVDWQAVGDRLRAFYEASPLASIERMVSDPVGYFGRAAQQGLENYQGALTGVDPRTGRELLGIERGLELINTLPGVAPAGGMVLGAGPMVRRAAKEPLEEMTEQAAKRGILAYHGSPHDFDRFDISRIGTGEGAQAYGHGLYFAESPDVADLYSRVVPGGGKGWSSAPPPAFSALSEKELALIPESIKDQISISWQANGNRTAKMLARNIFDQSRGTEYSDALHKLAYGTDWTNPGRMYEVNINANPEDFLDWDAPLSQQSEALQEIARTADLSHMKPGNRLRRRLEAWRGEWSPAEGAEVPELTGNELHSLLTDFGTNTEKNAELSERLLAAGIPGIRYLDQGSRAAGEGTRNYVTFSDDIVEILRKYGLAAVMAGGGATLAGTGEAQAQE